MEAAREILGEIDYAEPNVTMRWVELASRMYSECPDSSE